METQSIRQWYWHYHLQSKVNTHVFVRIRICLWFTTVWQYVYGLQLFGIMFMVHTCLKICLWFSVWQYAFCCLTGYYRCWRKASFLAVSGNWETTAALSNRVCVLHHFGCLIRIIMIIVAMKDAARDLFYNLCTTNCLQHQRSNDQGAAMCESCVPHQKPCANHVHHIKSRLLITCNTSKAVRRSCAPHHALITCSMQCARWCRGTAQLLLYWTELKSHLY